jgi:Protein of unknown function (DUF1236)
MTLAGIESRPGFYPHARFHDSRRLSLQRVPTHSKNAENCSGELHIFLGTMPRAMNWVGLRAGTSRLASIAKELNMRNRILAIAAIAAAISAPVAAQAQGVVTTGVVRGGSVIVNEDIDGIAVDQRPAFREYIVRERVPNYTIPDRVIVGGVLPETGVTYYDVPQTFGVTPYRYTVVNGRTVLVEPRTRRIVQVVE